VIEAASRGDAAAALAPGATATVVERHAAG
jgi:hypothetical protein